MATLPDIQLPAAIRSRYVENINGLRMHVLEAGYETKGRPCLLLLHGFPELAFSWRKVMPVLADAGYHVIAPVPASTCVDRFAKARCMYCRHGRTCSGHPRLDGICCEERRGWLGQARP